MPSFGYGVIGSEPNRRFVFVVLAEQHLWHGPVGSGAGGKFEFAEERVADADRRRGGRTVLGRAVCGRTETGFGES